MNIPINPGNFSGLAAVAGNGRAPNLSLPIPGSEGFKRQQALNAQLGQMGSSIAKAMGGQGGGGAQGPAQQQVDPKMALALAKFEEQKQNNQFAQEMKQQEMAERKRQFDLKIQQNAYEQARTDKAGEIEAKAAAGMSYLQLTPEEQEADETRTQIVSAGQQLGWFNEEEAQQLQMMPKPMFDTRVKTWTLQSVKALEIQKELAGKQAKELKEKGKVAQVYNPETGEMEETSQPLSTTQTTREQESIVNMLDQVDKMQQLGGDFKEEYLTGAGRIKDYVGQLSSLFPGISSKVIGEENTNDIRKWRQKKAGFSSTLGQFFAAYVKEMTGVQFGMKEFEMRKKEVINAFDDPDEFIGKFNSMLGNMKTKLEVKQTLLRQGVPLNTPQFQEAFDKTLNNLQQNVNSELSTTPDQPSTFKRSDGKIFSIDVINQAAEKLGKTPEEIIKMQGLDPYDK